MCRQSDFVTLCRTNNNNATYTLHATYSLQFFGDLTLHFFRTLLQCPLVNNLAREARPHEPLHCVVSPLPPPPSHCPSVVGCGHSTKYPSLVGCGHLYKTPLYCFLRAQKNKQKVHFVLFFPIFLRLCVQTLKLFYRIFNDLPD